ncbi:WD40 repeat-like protein [Polychaeton citri CBS 116435]|uniref:WD40 repeat-like protein n=1 Tax=Polychaeton citri CBS 116435 TaxID=1314669 RepID=A0A9P4URD3_9PEZI|nr:WD40 repeat-like protein [Polychaeton citri CBS 116435]
MAPPFRSKHVPRKDAASVFTRDLKKPDRDWKPVLFTEHVSTRPSNLAPNVRSLSWSPTGSLIATAIGANVRVWSPERPNVRQSIDMKNAGGGGAGLPTATLEKIGFCPLKEELLATTGADGGVRLWDVRLPGGGVGSGKGTKVSECKVGDAGLFLTWHPNGQEILIGRKDDGIRAVDIRKMTGPGEDGKWAMDVAERPLSKDRGQLNAMAFSNSGSELFATTSDGPVKILDYPSMSILHELKGHANSTHCVQHSPAGNYIAVGGTDSFITLWDTQTLHCANTITSHAGSVRELSFSFDGSYLCAGSLTDSKDSEKGLTIIHVESGEEVVKVETTNPVACVAWHPTRYQVAYSGDPGGLKIVGAGTQI